MKRRENKRRKVRKVNSKIVCHTCAKVAFMRRADCLIFSQMEDEKKKPSIFSTCCCPKATLDTRINIAVWREVGGRRFSASLCPTNISQSGCGLSLQRAILAYSYHQCEDRQTGSMIPPFQITSNWFKNFQILLKLETSSVEKNKYIKKMDCNLTTVCLGWSELYSITAISVFPKSV